MRSHVTFTLATLATAIVLCAGQAAAQDEAALKAYFEGRRVIVKLDMPGTSEGVDVLADASRPLDYGEYGNRLKRYGTALRAGDAAPITLIKMKKDLIEVHLAGGGYGTFWDDTSTSVSIPYVEKSERERELEHRVEKEQDERRRHDMQRELNELRERRERENRRIDRERAEAEARKAQLVAERRLSGGSRFNLRFNGTVPSGIRPAELMAALSPYLDFSDGPSAAPPPPPMRPTMPTMPGTPMTPAMADDLAYAMPRKGMTRQEAERLFGQPVQMTTRREGSVTITTLIFDRPDDRVTCEFVESVLVRYSVVSK